MTSKGPMSDLCSSTNSRFAIVRLMMSRTGSYGIIGENLRVEYAGSLLNQHQVQPGMLYYVSAPARIVRARVGKRQVDNLSSPCVLVLAVSRLGIGQRYRRAGGASETGYVLDSTPPAASSWIETNADLRTGEAWSDVSLCR